MSRRAPPEVREIRDALIVNAKAAGFPARRVYCRFDDKTQFDPGGWHICDNWEHQSPNSLVYRDGVWFSRDHEGVDRPYSLEQARGDASCWFTG